MRLPSVAVFVPSYTESGCGRSDAPARRTRRCGVAWSAMSQGGGRDGSSIRHQLAVLRRRWPVVALLSFVACVDAAWLTSIRPEVYQAKATVLLQPETEGCAYL